MSQDEFPELKFNIEKVSVKAKTKTVKADYSFNTISTQEEHDEHERQKREAWENEDGTICEKYYTHHQHNYDGKDFNGICWTSLPVLQQLWGLPWNNLALKYVHSVRPSCIRVTNGTVTCDAITWRVTVFVDENNIIEKISQEVELASTSESGSDLDQKLRNAKKGSQEEIQPEPFGAVHGLEAEKLLAEILKNESE